MVFKKVILVWLLLLTASAAYGMAYQWRGTAFIVEDEKGYLWACGETMRGPGQFNCFPLGTTGKMCIKSDEGMICDYREAENE